MPLQFITVGRHAAARSGRAVATLIAGLALVAASAAPALADPGAPGAADETVRRFSVGLFSGALLHSEKSGLGNAHYSDDVPQSGAAFGLRLGYTVFTGLEAELELLVNPTTMPHPPSDSALVLGGRLLARYELLAGATRPYLTAGFGQLRLQTDKPYVLSGDMDNTWIAGAGVIFDASYRLALRADARWVGGDARPKSGATLAHNVELTVGVSYAFGGPPEDRDGDGVPDEGDKCPEVAEDKDGHQDDDGCVDADNDSDGVPDAQDKCPDEAEDQDGYQDGDGCPDRDNDGDGVPDDKDKCRDKAEDKDGFEDEDGCPEADNDRDGVPDAADKCPVEPETKNGFQDQDGCPDAMPAHIAPLFQGPVKVPFKKAKLAKQAAPILEKLLELLLEIDSVKIEVHVHTGGKGKPEAEQKLAQARGEAIQAFYVNAGIEAGRILVVAHGSEEPISQKKGAKAVKENERVYFRVHAPNPPRP